MTGKITMPVCKAMDGRLNRTERKALWDIIKSKPQDAETVAEAIEILEQCGALDDCVTQAESVRSLSSLFARVVLRRSAAFARSLSPFLSLPLSLTLTLRLHLPRTHRARVRMHDAQIVEASWAQLDKVTPDTFAKLMLRAFAGYVIYR